MKKVIYGLIVIILAAGLAAGCASPEAAPAPTPAPAPAPTPTPTPSPTPAPAPSPAAPEPITLTLAHTTSPMHQQHKDVYVPFAQMVEERTEGRIKIVIHPAGALGKPSEMYDIVLKGTADISWMTPTYMPGLFPLEEVFHLPYTVEGMMGDPLSDSVRHMVYDKYLIPTYFKDIKVLWTGRYGLNELHMVTKPVRTMEDMKGTVVGFPGGKLMQQFLTALGASTEQVVVPDMYTAMERGIIDGMEIPMEAVLAFKLQEVEKYLTNTHLAGGTNLTIMNLNTWNSLSPADQKIFEEMSVWGENQQGVALNAVTKAAYGVFQKAGVQIIDISPEEKERWKELAKPVEEAWVADLEAKGIPARALYEDVQKMVAAGK